MTRVTYISTYSPPLLLGWLVKIGVLHTEPVPFSKITLKNMQLINFYLNHKSFNKIDGGGVYGDAHMLNWPPSYRTPGLRIFN